MRKTLLTLFLVAAASFAASTPVFAEAYGNFETIGVVADLPAGQTVDTISEVRVYIDDAGSWKRVQNAVRVGFQDFYASSVFDLAPDTSYDFKVEFYNLSHSLVDTQYMTGATRPEPAVPATANELFVSPSGGDGAAGTFAAPFATLDRALSVAAPGTTIYMRGGSYYNTEVHPTVSASQVSPIVIRAYGAEEPILDGADPSLINTAWTLLQPQVYRHAFTGDSRNVCLRRKSDGTVFRAYMMATAAEVTSQTSAGYTFAELNIDAAFCADGANITIRIPAGAVSDYDVFVSNSNSGIYLESLNSYYIDGLTFTHYGAGDYSRAIYVYSSSDVLIQNCKFLYNNVHVWIKNNSNRVTIQDNLCRDDTADWHFDYTKSMAVNYSGEIETGLVIVGGTYSGRGLVIRRNSITGTFDGSEIGAYTAYTGTRTAETDFYDNTIRHVADDFLELDGFVRNYRVFHNDMRESLSGISLAQALDGPTWIVRNIIADCGMCHAAQVEGYEGYPFKTNGGPYPDVGSGEAFFYHNTAYTVDAASRAVLVKRATWRKFTFRNNIWCGKARGLESWTSPLSPCDWDYDCLYTAAGDYAKIGTGGSAVYYADIAALRSGTGYLVHGTSAAPLLAAPDSGDYTLSLSSPCTDSGVLLPGINEDYLGSAPDMGANEFGSANDSDLDGLPDDWEIDNFGDLDETASGDPDGDGITNIDEYTGGTDPNQADAAGPSVSSVATVPAVVRCGVDLSISLTALADDTATGNSRIVAAEYFVGADPGVGSGHAAGAADGSFDASSEALVASVDTSAWPLGEMILSVRARDAAGFWSAAESITIDVVDAVPPAAITDLSAAAGNPPAEVASGSWSTDPDAAASDVEVITDLISPRELGSISLTADALVGIFPTDFTISGSPDGASWTALAAAKSFRPARGVYIWFFEPSEYRFVKLAARTRLDRRTGRYCIRVPFVAFYAPSETSSISLQWTAPADNGSDAASGPVSSYDVRYSLNPITAANFDAVADPISISSASAPGSNEDVKFSVGRLWGTVYVAVKSADDVPNWSTISNVASSAVAPFGLASVWPPDAYSATPASPLQFTYVRGGDVTPAFIAASARPDFPSKPIPNPGAASSSTKRFPLKNGLSYWKPTPGQWKSVLALAAVNKTIYWRLEGSSPGCKRMFGPTRSLFFDTGSITGAAVTPVHDLDGDDAIWPVVAAPPVFSWADSSHNMKYFYVDVSTDAGVPLDDRLATIVLGKGLPVGSQLTASPLEWQKIRRLASTSNGVLYWRVRATDANKLLKCASVVHKLVVDGGSWTVSPFDLSAANPKVTWTNVGSGIVKFTLQVSIDASFPPGAKSTLTFPAASVAASEYTLTAAEVLRIQAFAAKSPGATLYYRVLGEDAERKFLAPSPSSTVTLP